MIKVAHADPVKSAILSKSLQMHDVQVPTFKPLSVLELQSLRRKKIENRNTLLLLRNLKKSMVVCIKPVSLWVSIGKHSINCANLLQRKKMDETSVGRY